MWTGTLPTGEALALVDGLLDIAESRYAADSAGSRSYLGWDEQTRILAQLHDVIRFLLPGVFGVKVPAEAAWPRPKPRDLPESADAVGSIADFDADAFLAGRW